MRSRVHQEQIETVTRDELIAALQQAHQRKVYYVLQQAEQRIAGGRVKIKGVLQGGHGER